MDRLIPEGLDMSISDAEQIHRSADGEVTDMLHKAFLLGFQRGEKAAVDLERAASFVSAASGLLDDVALPSFQGWNSKGIINAYAERTDGDAGKAAQLWIEERYDALYAACTACLALVVEALDIIQ